MSCECNINYVKEIETKYVKIFKLQGICLKCRCSFSSVKNTEKGMGFAKWALSMFKKKAEAKQ